MSERSPSGTEALLERASPRGRALYRLVRALLDELEDAAPWSLLYAPPADGDELARRLGALLERIAGVPARVAGELAQLADAASSDEEREALDEAEFYFSTLHQMTATDQQRLAAALARNGGAAPTRAESDRLCELAADLKGKYTSATMSAAAALVGEGRGRGVEFEAQLFPEKAEEAERNRRLLDALERTVRALRAVVASFAWRGVLASWRQRRPVDRYVLGDLVALRAHVLYLLTVANRRALYSGDYQFLRGRETLLGARLRRLEDLHLRSLDVPLAGADAASEEAGGESGEETSADDLFARLQQRLLEVAALLDVEALREQIGDESFRALRAGAAPADEPGEPSLEELVGLIAEEDIKTFLELLVGAVRKRASIAHRAVAAAATAPSRRESGPVAVPAVRIDPEAGRAYAARLVAALARLTDEASPRWRAFQMVHKLQARLGALPPALLHEMAPFLGELTGDLLPILDEAGQAGAVPAAAVNTLRGCAERLSAHDLSRPDAAHEMASDLARVVRLLDSLRAAADALRLTR